jgi:hypothetical protein
LFSLAGQYDNSIPTQFLDPTDCLKIPALVCIYLFRQNPVFTSLHLRLGHTAIFGLKQILANMKQIFIRLEANKTGFIHLFGIKAMDFTCETNKNGMEYFFLGKYFIYFASKHIF